MGEHHPPLRRHLIAYGTGAGFDGRMRLRSFRGPWRARALASFVVLSVGWSAGCAGGGAARYPSGASRQTVAPGERTVRLLQMNLCNSGRAACYDRGRAITVAAALLRHDRPDMVTLNEVCRDDVDVLKRAISSTFHGAPVASAFRAAEDRVTKAPVRCENGQEFGDGVLLVRAPASRHVHIFSGVYPMQDPSDVEERVWVCIDLATQFSGCTTHTASTDTAIALAQCRYLLSSAVQTPRRRGGKPIILAGDLNLRAGGSPNPQSCLPRGYQRTDDGALQDVMASPGITIRSHAAIDMQGATDHPGLLVDLVLSSR